MISSLLLDGIAAMGCGLGAGLATIGAGLGILLSVQVWVLVKLVATLWMLLLVSQRLQVRL